MDRSAKRWRVLADPKIQGALCIRVALYWICCLIVATVLVGAWLALDDLPGSLDAWLVQVWRQSALAVLVTVLLLPLVLVDVLIVSNRFAGPLRRIRGAMKQLADGHDVPPITFRAGDFYPEIAQEFNRIARRVQILSQDPFPAQPSATTRSEHAPEKTTPAVPDLIHLHAGQD